MRDKLKRGRKDGAKLERKKEGGILKGLFTPSFTGGGEKVYGSARMGKKTLVSMTTRGRPDSSSGRGGHYSQ